MAKTDTVLPMNSIGTGEVANSSAAASSLSSTAKMLIIVGSVIGGLVLIGVVVFVTVWFTVVVKSDSKSTTNSSLTTTTSTQVTCAANASSIDNVCYCNSGYSGDGVNYCDECGLSFSDPNVRIVGGVEAVKNSWPAMAFIYFKVSGSFYVDKLGKKIEADYTSNCGATIIDRKTVQHENYNASTYSNDIVLLKLSEPLQFNNFVQVACLPSSTFNKSKVYPSDNVDSWATGWGATSENGITSDLLLNVKLTVYNTSMCAQDNKDWNAQICAGEIKGGKDACQGDSGGPLYVKDTVNGKNKYVQVGVVSYGIGCARKGNLGIYGRVSYFIPWIQRFALL